MPLTDLSARNAKPQDKPYRLADGLGMYLESCPTAPSTGASNISIAGKEKRLALGVYPSVGLTQARTARDDACRLIAAGTDPSQARKEAKLATTTARAHTFEVVAREWHEKQSATWVPTYATKVLHSLETDVFPDLGARPVTEITAPQTLATLRKVESRDALETVARLQQRCSAVFRYAIVTGRAIHNPCTDLRKPCTAQTETE
ncbi:tyrosine-type recombinase/integrase [Ralstonia solanacearum]|uniref:tyrosine-type recombinase/integrase n=1 Tax=Ralstonia solanacearum TaxID=305 RepID=UPI0015FC797E|nr:integrase arm-type DNA-binding domain-containing protein [Ralstonia solanacearum]